MAGERHSAVNITAVSVTVSDLMCELHAEGQEGAMHVGRGGGGGRGGCIRAPGAQGSFLKGTLCLS